jgi:hypothetical protein
MAASQPYNQTTDTQVWIFNYAAAGTFNGTFNMTTYAATNIGARGGANFAITYTPGEGDPTGTSVRWIQVIDTNMPSPRGVTYGVPGTGANGIPIGTTAYLDNQGPSENIFQPGPPIDPFYGWASVPEGGTITDSMTANSGGFSDAASLLLVPGLFWEAQAFLASQTYTITSTGRIIENITIYGGVQWGFADASVPEPSTIVMTMTATVAGLVYGWRRHSHATRRHRRVGRCDASA